ncbi:MAG TPA: hypothetical protein VHP83_25930, partial [Aggregatilineaceae bacterium]|nr:hypothetical protein [Aggregatilineaceae bacterium]
MLDPTKTTHPEPVEASPKPKSPLLRVMHALGRLTRDASSGENQKAVQMFNRMSAAREVFSGAPLKRAIQRARGIRAWPVTSGSYVVSDLSGCVAICT